MSRMGIWEWNFETGTLKVSKELEAIHGLSEGDVHQLIKADKPTALIDYFVVPEDRDRLLKDLRIAINSHADYSSEYRVRLSDGSIRWMLGRGRVEYNENGNPRSILGTIMDITSHKNAEVSARRSEKLFQQLFEATADALFLLTVDTQAIKAYNQQAVELFDLNDKKQLVGTMGYLLQKYPNTPNQQQQLSETLQDNKFWTADLEYVTKAGKEFWGNVAISLIEIEDTQHYLVRIRDITERKLSEEKIRKSERLLQEIFEESADALILFDTETGKIDQYNAHAADLFGFSNPLEAQETALEDLQKYPFTKDKKDQLIKRLRAKKHWSEEMEFKSRTGREFWGHAAATLIAVEGEQYYLLRVTDITERRMAVEAIEKALGIIEKDNNRKTAELEEARNLQLSMLPQHTPDLASVEMGMFMKTCTEVGGDYYDYLMDDNGTLTVAIGDATGHGLKAGIVVATVKSYFKTLGNQYGAVELLGQISEGIKNLQIRGMYMGLTIVKIKDNEITIASSGMPPLYLYRKATAHIEEISLKGLFLGSDIAIPYKYITTTLEPGDALLALSDGLPELFNYKREMLGYEPIKSRFIEVATEAPGEIISALTKLGDKWANGKSNEDDITLVVIKAKQNN